jgi:hypothetical protein
VKPLISEEADRGAYRDPAPEPGAIQGILDLVDEGLDLRVLLLRVVDREQGLLAERRELSPHSAVTSNLSFSFNPDARLGSQTCVYHQSASVSVIRRKVSPYTH